MKSTVYELAVWLEDTNWNLLSPNRAIFSALCSVLSNYDEDKQKKILWGDIYSNVKILEHLVKTEDTLLKNFMDVTPSVLVCSYTPWDTQMIIWDIHGFDDIELVNIPIFTEDQRKKSLFDVLQKWNQYKESKYRILIEKMQKWLKITNSQIRLIAEKLRIEHFPTTEEFKEDHHTSMDKKIWLDKFL